MSLDDPVNTPSRPTFAAGRGRRDAELCETWGPAAIQPVAIEMYGVCPCHELGRPFTADVWKYAFQHDQIVVLCYDLLDAKVLYRLPYCVGAGPHNRATCSKLADRLEAALALFEDGNTPPDEPR